MTPPFRFAAVLAVAAGAVLGFSIPAHAVLVSYEGTVRITGSPFSNVAVGDMFDFAFTYDDTTAGVTDIGNTGVFFDALTAFSLSRHAGNSGAWDPAGGTFNLPNRIDTEDSGAIDGFEVGVGGPGFAQLDEGGTLRSFGAARLNFRSTSDFVNNTGTGQLLADQVGLLPEQVAFYDLFYFSLEAIIGPVDPLVAPGELVAFRQVSVDAVVPEPETVTLTLFGLGALVLATRRRRGKDKVRTRTLWSTCSFAGTKFSKPHERPLRGSTLQGGRSPCFEPGEFSVGSGHRLPQTS